MEADKNLSKEVKLVLIGGTALVVKYLSPRATMDVDSYTKVAKELQDAWKKAEKAIGVKVPLSYSAGAEGPYEMADRFTLYQDLKLKYLKILVPEAADIVLMKVLRFAGKDRDDIEHLVRKYKIPHKLLLKRFKDEMGHVIGDRKTLISYYLLAIEENYGSKIANAHEKSIKSKKKM
jgi:hypothetical protein